jgi:hypothetical protein
VIERRAAREGSAQVAIKAHSKRKSTRRPSKAQASKDGARSADMPPLIDIFKLLIEPGSALSNFQALALRQWLAPWIIFMRAYRETLDEGAASLSPEDRARRFTKSLMSTYLDFEKSTLDQRSFLAAQREMLDAWLGALEGCLRTTRPAHR